MLLFSELLAARHPSWGSMKTRFWKRWWWRRTRTRRTTIPDDMPWYLGLDMYAQIGKKIIHPPHPLTLNGKWWAMSYNPSVLLGTPAETRAWNERYRP